jgi:hypothetical protein
MLVTMALLIGTGLLLARKWFKAMARRPAAGDTKQEL